MEVGINRYFQDLLCQYLEIITNDPSTKNFPTIPVTKLKYLLLQISSIFINEKNILELSSPFIIIGDIHGHIFDLLRIFNRFGIEKDTKYLFLGDLVDRGENSLQTISLIFILKYLYPNRFYIIRGNHEFDIMCSKCGFKEEIMELYDNLDLYNTFIDCFNVLPICAIIDNEIFLVHGGIGPDFKTLDQINLIERPISHFENNILSSLLWSDPSTETEYFLPSQRGLGFLYGINSIKNFLDINKFKILIRGHECVQNGILTHFNNLVYTIFSASNYCGLSGNESGVIEIHSKENLELHRFPFIENEISLKSTIPSSKAETLNIFNSQQLILQKKRNISSLISKVAPMAKVKTRSILCPLIKK